MERGIGKEEAEIQNELNEFLAASDALLFLSTEQDEELMSAKWGSLHPSNAYEQKESNT